jgi:transposase-like protein
MGKHVTKEYYDGQGRLIIKPYLLKDLAAIFDVNHQTLKRWMNRFPQELSEKFGKHYSVKQVEFLLDKFGRPHKESIVLPPKPVKRAA